MSMKYLIIFAEMLLSTSILANSVICPESFTPLTYDSPTQGKKVTTCISRVNGKIIRKDPLSSAPQRSSIVNKIEKQDLNAILKEASLKLLKGLIAKSKNDDLDTFSTIRCQGNRMEWASLLMGKKKELNLNYRFIKGCSLYGHFKAITNKPFPVRFKIKDIKEITEVQMNVTINTQISMTPKLKMLIAEFKVNDMKIYGPGLKGIAEASYKVGYGFSGRVVKNYSGKINITSVNGERIDYKDDIYIPFDE